MTASISTFSASPLQPVVPKPDPLWFDFQFGASLSIVKGSLVAVKNADGKVYPYVAQTYVAQPATPTFTASGSGSAWVAGDYSVAITYTTALGETIPCPPQLLTLTAAQNIVVPVISGIDATVTTVRVYVNGFLAASIPVSAQAIAQTNVTGYGAGFGNGVPMVNTAGKTADGTQIARGIAPFDIYTDASGNISTGQSNPGEFGQTYTAAPIYVHGYFSCADLTGLDANAVAALGRLVYGTTSTGILCMN